MTHSAPGTPKVTSAGRSLGCKVCNTYVTSTRYVVSEDIRGFRGKAAIFRSVSDTTIMYGPERIQRMASGSYTVRAITCHSCDGYLGWLIVCAHDAAHAWKNGCVVIELECVGDQDERDVLEGELRRAMMKDRKRSGRGEKRSVWKRAVEVLGQASRIQRKERRPRGEGG